MKLNLASGNDYKENWLNVDVSLKCKTDFVFDLLTFPWPWEDNSAEEIYCAHFLEHIGEEFIAFMDECCRILRPGGNFRIRCPYYTSIRAVQDPTHKRFISEHMFQYFSAAGRKALNVEHYPIKSDFDIEEIRFHFPVEMSEVPDDERKYLLQHCWNTAADIEVLLKKHDPNQQSLDRQENKVLPN